ncbi:MAG: hypothetical protein WBA22_13490 [Candidatus Methanofastidiosia archaeon]
MVRKDLSRREKLLLQLMGREPNLTNQELSSIIGFKYTEYVTTIQRKLERREYLGGPYMYPDFGKIFKNKVSRVFAFVMFDSPYEYIISMLREINCWTYFFPLEEGIFKKYMVGFMNTDLTKLKRILDLLKDSQIIKYYHLFELDGNWKLINPTFLVNDREASPEPDFGHLLEDVPIPDLSWGSFSGIALNKVAQILIMRLWNGHGACDLRRIVRIEKKFKKIRRAELKELLRKEHLELKREELKAELRELRTVDLSLREFREAYQLLMDRDILEKVYYIWPFPNPKCSRFMLFLRCDSVEATKRIIFNFGRDTRIFTRVCMVQSVERGEPYGVIYAVGDPFLGGKLMTELDQYDELVDRKLFPMRSYPPGRWKSQSILMEYYDEERQTLEFPYGIFYEKVRQRLEEDVLRNTGN